MSDELKNFEKYVDYVSKQSAYSPERIEFDNALKTFAIAMIEIVSEQVYLDLKNGIYTAKENIDRAIKYYLDKEDFEKCAFLHNVFETKYLKNFM